MINLHRPHNAMSGSFHGSLTPADGSRLAESTVLIGGGGGNIGSYVIPLVARTKVGKLRIIDRGYVEAKNLANQAYTDPNDVGRPKAEVLAEQVRRIAPDVVVESIVANIEDVPLGQFADVDLCMGCFDSLRARQLTANERAYRMRLPYVDGGVDAGGDWVGKVQVFAPGMACLECSWGNEHYRQIGRETPCEPDGEVTGLPTLAPALLGSAVASLMVAEGVKILLGHTPPESFEIAFDLASLRWLTSTLRRATGCRFDHQMICETLTLSTPFGAATVNDLLAVLHGRFGDEPLQLQFSRRVFDDDQICSGRFVSTGQLKHLAARRLSELRLSQDDRIRVEHEGSSFAVALRKPK